jgi:hypothetical protein
MPSIDVQPLEPVEQEFDEQPEPQLHLSEVTCELEAVAPPGEAVGVDFWGDDPQDPDVVDEPEQASGEPEQTVEAEPAPVDPFLVSPEPRVFERVPMERIRPHYRDRDAFMAARLAVIQLRRPNSIVHMPPRRELVGTTRTRQREHRTASRRGPPRPDNDPELAFAALVERELRVIPLDEFRAAVKSWRQAVAS